MSTRAQLERAIALIDEHGIAIDCAGRVYAAQLDCLAGTPEAVQASHKANAWLDAELAPISDPSVRSAYAQTAENQRIRAG